LEWLGFSTLLLPDLIGTAPAPLTTLAPTACANSTLGTGTWVLNNELRHPAVVAHEAATLDLLSDNRFQLGA
jgi:alkanesulfonate monooxygenase SsuD/methylene tetrahydromethanopterin reductase-like flavin-dependent oxidoreductase (luciferase family)